MALKELAKKAGISEEVLTKMVETFGEGRAEQMLQMILEAKER